MLGFQPPVAPEADGGRGLGQVFTPEALARQAATWLDFDGESPIRVLDPGAGNGALSEAVCAAIASRGVDARLVRIDMVENDSTLVAGLQQDLTTWPEASRFDVRAYKEDFLDLSRQSMCGPGYSHIIMNPPYSRFNNQSSLSRRLKTNDIEVSNIYGAFLWIAADLLQDGGELVAIVPRSFCNGHTFRQLRRHLLTKMSLVRLHSFNSRTNIFERDGILQEVVVVKFQRGGQGCSDVLISSSDNVAGMHGKPSVHYRANIVSQESEGLTIRIPLEPESEPYAVKSTRSLFLTSERISTGSVVDFRMPAVTESYSIGCVPLIDSRHPALTERPRGGGPRYLERTPVSERHIFPPGNYVVVKRVSPKEQVPRIRAAIVTHEEAALMGGVAFENHVNVISKGRAGLPIHRAVEILQHLQSPDAQAQFVELSGTTQVNVRDLRALRLGAGATILPADGIHYA